MDDEKAEGQQSQSSVARLIDAAVDTGAEALKGTLKRTAKKKLPASVTQAKSLTKAAKKSPKKAGKRVSKKAGKRFAKKASKQTSAKKSKTSARKSKSKKRK